MCGGGRGSSLPPCITQHAACIAQRAEALEPGIGPLIASDPEALPPPVETFRSGWDFAAWVGLPPVQRSTGGMEHLGRISRMGERTLRRLLIIGASAVVR